MQKYYKLSRKDREIKEPLELKFIKLSSLSLATFLIAFVASSVLAPTETTSADSQLLLANQSTGGSVSITTSGNINLSLASNSAGAVRTASDTVTVSSDATGYQLYISTATSSNALIRSGATSTGIDSITGENTYASSDLIPAISTNNANVSITSPVTLDNNTWGFAVAKQNTAVGSGSEDVVPEAGFDESYPTGDNSVATSKFASVPTKGNDVLIAKRTITASSVPTTFYYGAKVTSSKPSGLYQNTITYTVIGDSSTTGLASITPERTNQISGGVELSIATPSTLALASIASTSVTVGGEECTNPTPAKSDNGTGSTVNVTCISPSLASGWHEVSVTFTTTSGATESYVVNPGIEYFVEEGGASGGGSIVLAGTFQTFDSDSCEALKGLSEAGVMANLNLTDERDQKSYGVAYFPDGHCWMTQNLRLGNANTAITLKSTDSDVSSDYTIAASAIVNSGSTSWSGTVDAQHIYVQSDTSYGNLYNWFTATAGTGTSSMKSTSATNTTDATSSVCPKGWKLPLGNQSDYSFYNLTQKAGIANSSAGSMKIRGAPYSFTYAGRYSSGLYNQGNLGRYWSRSAYIYAGGAYGLDFDSSSVSPQYNPTKFEGYSVRCVYSG